MGRGDSTIVGNYPTSFSIPYAEPIGIPEVGIDPVLQGMTSTDDLFFDLLNLEQLSVMNYCHSETQTDILKIWRPRRDLQKSWFSLPIRYTRSVPITYMTGSPWPLTPLLQTPQVTGLRYLVSLQAQGLRGIIHETAQNSAQLCELLLNLLAHVRQILTGSCRATSSNVSVEVQCCSCTRGTTCKIECCSHQSKEL